jgi:hypothetical protein
MQTLRLFRISVAIYLHVEFGHPLLVLHSSVCFALFADAECDTGDGGDGCYGEEAYDHDCVIFLFVRLIVCFFVDIVNTQS